MKCNIETTRRSLAQKLGPDSLLTSTFVRSLLGYLLEEPWAFPAIIGLQCTPDGALFAQEEEGDCYHRLLCNREELIRAILYLTPAANLTVRERTYLLERIPSPVRSPG